MQYLVNVAQFPRLESPKPPVIIDAPDDEAILAKAGEIVAQVRGEGAEKVRVQIRRAANLLLVGHVGDAA